MTRNNLIKFLKETYEPNEQLVWQTISYEDVEDKVAEAIPKYYEATPESWADFIESQEYYGELADQISELVFNKFVEYVESLYSQEEDE
jgi:hypothetical protein